MEEKDYEGERVICVEGLYKIFGPDPETVLQNLEAQKKNHTESVPFSSSEHVVALNDINLEVYAGEIFVVMGLSGSGKSTLLRCINRLVEATAGRVMVDDTEISGLSKKELRHIRSEKLGMVFQHYALLPHRNVLDNVAFGLEVQGEAREARYEKAKQALKLVGLDGWETRMPAQLSGGMQQRVGLARALALDPPILLMDEPFSGLDPLIRKQMQKELLSLQNNLQKTIIFITHDLEEAIAIGDRIVILKNGKIEQLGSPDEIVLSPSGEYVEAFVRDIDLLKILPAKEVMVTDFATFILEENQTISEQNNKHNAYGQQPIFIVDGNGQYVGVLSAEEFQKANAVGPDTIRDQIADRIPSLKARDQIRQAMEILDRPPFAVAVTDRHNRLIGAVTRESVFSRLGQSKKS